MMRGRLARAELAREEAVAREKELTNEMAVLMEEHEASEGRWLQDLEVRAHQYLLY